MVKKCLHVYYEEWVFSSQEYPFFPSVHYRTWNTGHSAALDHHNSACEHWKSSSKGHHGCEYLDVTTSFTNFILLQLLLKQSFAMLCSRKVKQTKSR